MVPEPFWMEAPWNEMTYVAGVDEVGRGPLAGPVVAAAVVLDSKHPIQGLKDSKRISEKRRERLSEEIQEKARCWSLGRAEVEEIDRINILQATLLAMRRAVEGLSVTVEHAWVDGNHCPNLSCSTRAVVGGDRLIPVISAASIIAKVARDREMAEMDRRFPGYGLARHKGYPTRAHLEALGRLGVSKIHRRSFAPVKCLLEKE